MIRLTRRVTVTGVATGVVLLAGACTAFLLTSPSAPKQARPAAPATAQVTRTDLATSVTLQGALGYADEHTVKGSAGGRVTWLPRAGADIGRGQPLMRVDDHPVLAFYGRTPLFRTLDTVGTVGRDVKVVAQNLAALGYNIGSQPPPGTVVVLPTPAADDPTAPDDPAKVPEDAASKGASEPPGKDAADRPRYTLAKPDAVLTRALMTAIRAWQRNVGLPQTGTLAPDDAIVLAGKRRVTAVNARIGDDAANPVLTIASRSKVVSVPLNPGDTDGVRAAAKVKVTLPGGGTATATVAAIRTVTGSGKDGSDATDQRAQLATLTFDKPSAVKDAEAGPVQVTVTGEVQKGVLAVPVGALLALSGGGYGVELPDGNLLAVTTGLFVKGMVQISGDGIDAGMRVVTTS